VYFSLFLNCKHTNKISPLIQDFSGIENCINVREFQLKALKKCRKNLNKIVYVKLLFLKQTLDVVYLLYFYRFDGCLLSFKAISFSIIRSCYN
jgi:hypothetical protein